MGWGAGERPWAGAPAASKPAAAPSAKAPAARVPVARPPPNMKTYMPTFMAPEAYGKKANSRSFAQMKKDAEAEAARAAAKREREKAARRKRNQKKGNEAVTSDGAEDTEEMWQLALMIAAGVLFAVAEAVRSLCVRVGGAACEDRGGSALVRAYVRAQACVCARVRVGARAQPVVCNFACAKL